MALVLAAAGCGTGADSAATDPIRVRVLEASPQGRVTETVPIRVRFDQPVIEPEEVGVTIDREFFAISPRIAGLYQFTAIDELEFRPSAPFGSATRYRVAVRPEVVGLGRTLTGERQFRFHTTLFALVGSAWSERNGQAQVTLRFSHPVDPAEVAAAALFETSEGAYVAADRVTRGPGRKIVLELPFSLAAARERGVRLFVDGSLRALTGGEPLSKTVVRGIPSEGAERELRITSVRSGTRGVRLAIEIETSEPVDPDAIRSHLEIEPAVEDLEIVDRGRGALLFGRLVGGSSYRVRLGAGLAGRDGGQLFDPFEARVEVATPGAGLEFEDQDRFPRVPSDGRIRVRTRGVQRAQLVVQPVAEVNAVHLLDVLERGVPLSSPTLIEEPRVLRWTVDDAESLDERSVVIPAAPGAHILRVSLQDADRPWLRVDRWVLGRGLTLVVKRSASMLWAFVLDAGRGQPAAGARVRVRSANNRVLGEERTGDDGVAAISLGEGRPAVVSVDRGDDFAFLSLRGSRIVRPPKRDAAAPAGLLVDADASAPGEPVRALAFAPAAEAGEVVDFTWRDRDGGEVGTASERIDIAGWVDATLQTPHFVDRDALELEARLRGGPVLGGAQLRLDAAFHRAFGLTVTPVASEVPPRFTVRADGARLVTARCRYTSRILAGPDQSTARGDFEPFVGPRQLVEGAQVACPIPDGVRGPAWVELEAEAVDRWGRRARRSVRAPFGRDRALFAFRVRVRPAASVGVAMLGPTGELLPRRTIGYQWSRRLATPTLAWVEGRGLIRRGRVLEVPVSSGRTVTTDGVTAIPVPDDGPGRYRLVVESEGIRGERRVTLGDGQPELPVDVTPARPAAGAPIRVRIRSEEPGWALVSIEQDRVLAHAWVQIVGGVGDAELRLPLEAGPRLHLVVVHAGRANVQALTTDVGPAPARVSLRPYGTRGGRLRYLVRVDPPAPSSVVVAPGSRPALRAVTRAWERQGALQVATHSVDLVGAFRARSTRSSTTAPVAADGWHTVRVGADGWGVLEVAAPLPSGPAPGLIRQADRLDRCAIDVPAHPDDWVDVDPLPRVEAGDEAPVAWRGADSTPPVWYGADDGVVRAEAPGPLDVAAQVGAAVGRATVVVDAPPSIAADAHLWAGYERPGTAKVPAGDSAWAWVGPHPAWLGTGTLLTLAMRPPDAAGLAAYAVLERELGAVMVESVLSVAGLAPWSRLSEDLKASLSGGEGSDPWPWIAAAVALGPAGLPPPPSGDEVAAVRRALRGRRPEPVRDPLAQWLVEAIVAPSEVDLDAVLARPERHPAKEALRIWVAQRAYLAQGPRSYWGSLDLDGAPVRRFNYERAISAELPGPGTLTVSTTGSGRAFVGVASLRRLGSGSGLALTGLDGAARDRFLVGDAAWLVLSVPREGRWAAELGLPAGLALEALSGWRREAFEGGPPPLGPDAIRYDPSRHRLVVTAARGPGVVRALVRAEWPGRYAGAWARVGAAHDRGDVRAVRGDRIEVVGATKSP